MDWIEGSYTLRARKPYGDPLEAHPPGGRRLYRELLIVLKQTALRVRRMKKKTSNKSASDENEKVRRAARKKKSNEVSSEGSLPSSLTAEVAMARSADDAAEAAGQSGDVQGISNIAEADAESVAELLEDGQALEAEVISGVEDAPDEREVPARGRIEDESPHSFDERNKI
jgi:hypothetical protein